MTSESENGDHDAWLRAVAAGDLDALERLYRELRVAVFAVAIAVVRDHALAEDVLQDTFVRVCEKAQLLPARAHDPRAWVLAIARNLAVDALRRRRVRSGRAHRNRPREPSRWKGLLVTRALLELEPLEREIVVAPRPRRARPTPRSPLSSDCRPGPCAGSTARRSRRLEPLLVGGTGCLTSSLDRLRQELERFLARRLAAHPDRAARRAEGRGVVSRGEGTRSRPRWRKARTRCCSGSTAMSTSAAGLLDEAIRWYERSLRARPDGREDARPADRARMRRSGDADDAVDRTRAASRRRSRRRRSSIACSLRPTWPREGTTMRAMWSERGPRARPGRSAPPAPPGNRPRSARAAPTTLWASGRGRFELDGEFVDPRYSRVFLLQRLGRDDDAAAEWEAIIAWLLERGFEVEAEWPKRELDRLRGERR